MQTERFDTEQDMIETDPTAEHRWIDCGDWSCEECGADPTPETAEALRAAEYDG